MLPLGFFTILQGTQQEKYLRYTEMGTVQKGRGGPTEALNVRLASLCLSRPTWVVGSRGGMGQPSCWRSVL